MPTEPHSSISNSEARLRLAVSLATLCVAVVVGLVLFVWVPLSSTMAGSYLAAAFDKQSALAARNDKPSILIYGGSSVAFSVSAEDIADDLDVPAVNLGLQASLGLAPLGLYAPQFRPPDDVLVLIVSPTIVGSVGQVSRAQCDLVFLQKSLAAALRTPSCLPMVLWRQIHDIRNLIAPRDGGASVYQRQYFNGSGDMVGHLDRPAQPLLPIFTMDEIDPARVETYIRQIEALTPGMERIVLPPPAAKGYCAANGEALDALVAQVHAELDTSGHPTAPLFCIDDTLFFDAFWHLGAQGRRQYTAYILDALRDRF